jgi:hypothetical protein
MIPPLVFPESYIYVGFTVKLSKCFILQIFVNGNAFCRFTHRFKPEEITHFRILGDIEPQTVTYHSYSVSRPSSKVSVKKVFSNLGKGATTKWMTDHSFAD